MNLFSVIAGRQKTEKAQDLDKALGDLDKALPQVSGVTRTEIFRATLRSDAGLSGMLIRSCNIAH